MSTKKKRKSISPRLNIERRLFQGNNSDIYEAVDTETNEKYIIKVVDLNKKYSAKMFENEKETLEILSPREEVVECVETFEKNQVGYFFFPKSDYDLMTLIQTPAKHFCKKCVLKRLLLCIKTCHSEGIAHMDIKPENVLVNLDGRVKLCDFGLSVRIIKSGNSIKGCAGTPFYQAPETFRSKSFNPFIADIWSFGITAFTVITRLFPYNTTHQNKLKRHTKLFKEIDMRQLIDRTPGLTDEEREFLYPILIVKPSKRASIEQIIEHPWLECSSMDCRVELNTF
jgi:serine/threonine protein kinase